MKHLISLVVAIVLISGGSVPLARAEDESTSTPTPTSSVTASASPEATSDSSGGSSSAKEKRGRESAKAAVAAKAASKHKKALAACENVEKKLSARLEAHAQSKDKHVARYQEMHARALELVSRLQAAGYDTTALEASLTEFHAKLVVIAQQYAEYEAALSAADSATCGSAETDFKAKLATARTELKDLHVAVRSARTYWEQDVKKELKALRSQEKASSSPSPSASATQEVR